ncbi:MAG: UDP-N-acetylmuramoyl-L-alanine--D-glutamate ligase, partial [Phototrophicaceae bacterium]
MVTRLNGRKVLIMGFARQGQSLARWLPTQGARVTVNDAKTQEQLQVNLSEYGDVRFVLGGHPLDLLDVTDLICVSGGVPLTLPFLEVAQNMRIPFTNDAQLFMERVSAPVIGITGSAGKTTTTTLVGEMLKHAGITTHVGGNIGYVLLDELPTIQPSDWVVMELSSFQLELMTTSPHIAAILNITPNHLDRHGTMEAYTHAKAQLIEHQRAEDVAVLAYDDPVTHALHERVQGSLVWFSLDSMVSNGAFLMGERLMLVGQANPNGGASVICERADIPLRGEHNVRNVLAACAIAGSAGVSVEVMQETIR